VQEERDHTIRRVREQKDSEIRRKDDEIQRLQVEKDNEIRRVQEKNIQIRQLQQQLMASQQAQ